MDYSIMQEKFKSFYLILIFKMANWINHSTFKKNGNGFGWKQNYENYKTISNNKALVNEECNNLLVNSQDIQQIRGNKCLNNKNNKNYAKENVPVMWSLYFPDEEYTENSDILKNIKIFYSFLTSIKKNLNLELIEFRRSIEIDFSLLTKDQYVLKQLPEIKEKFKQDPELYLNCLSAAAYQMLQKFDKENIIFSDVQYSYLRLHCRIINFELPTQLKLLKANYYGKLITVKGTVVRTSSSKPICLQMAYKCSVCASIQLVRWPDGKCFQPTICQSTSCRGRTFIPLRNNPKTLTADCQTIRLHELNEEEIREVGRIPRTIECQLTADLVDTCLPGDVVTITGIVKVKEPPENEKGGRKKDQCIFILYLDANSVVNNCSSKSHNSLDNVSVSQSGIQMDYAINELYAIEDIQSHPQLFKLLIGSLCPSIYGHEIVKAGLILGLFGGTQKNLGDRNSVPIRADPHVLIVGDPGLGKSQMLQAVSNLCPRSVFVCANSSTMAGLTVSISRNAENGESVLDAGALVLADQGCCCIDEFDKLGSHHQALLEAMEQQTISIAKAGIVCSLPARTSIIAAANPSGGHYNKAKTVAENLRMSSAILSRFDLVFILLDKPDEVMDSKLSEHVMAMHAGKKRSHSNSLSSSRNTSISQSIDIPGKPLCERLKISVNESLDLIPVQLLRKYIGYARQYVQPVLSAEAAEVLQNFYIDLRRKHQSKDATPITTRQLESMIRLSEARARLELREKVTKEDAEDVIEIMKWSMIDTFSDLSGNLDFQRSQHGSGTSSRSQGKKFIMFLQKIVSTRLNPLFTSQELTQLMKDGGIEVRDKETFLNSLNDQGYLLMKGSKLYELQAI